MSQARTVFVSKHASWRFKSGNNCWPKSLDEGPVLLLELLTPFRVLYRDVGTGGGRSMVRYNLPIRSMVRNDLPQLCSLRITRHAR